MRNEAVFRNACSAIAIWGLDGALSRDVRLPGSLQMRVHLTVTNVLNHPIWGTAGLVGEPSINSTTFAQTTDPLTSNGLGSRQMHIRAEVRF